MNRSEKLREAVLDLLSDVETQALREDERRAIGWVVLSFDENPSNPPRAPGVFGNPFETEEEAVVWAARHFEEVNRGAEPGDGWITSVCPLLPPR